MVGSFFGPYEIVATLGAGGMGEVYRARDSRLHREVALKVLSGASPNDSDRQRRFLQEARAASALNHPNILSVYDVGDENGTQYIVSELVEGESLGSLIQKGHPFPTRRFLEIVIQVADGLTAAHEAGIVHRDLKPENIMVTRDNRVKILDFGLAKPLHTTTGSAEDRTLSHLLTLPGVILGTASYMSPEQARGDDIDFRSDHFSFGLILYEMATGKKAFHKDTPVQTLSAIITEDPPPISSLNSKFPPPLRWLIERCLAKDRRERYGATIDLHHELRAVRDHLSETSFSADGFTARKAFVTTTQRISLAILVTAVLAALVTALLLWPSPVPDLSSYRFTPVAINDEIESYPAWSPDGKSIAYVAEVNGILQVFTRSLLASTPVQVTNSETDCIGPKWSPDGTRIGYGSKRKREDVYDIWIVGAAGGSPQLLMENAGGGAVSPDGKAFLFFRADASKRLQIFISSPIGSEPKQYSRSPFTEGRFYSGDLSFSPDGTKIGASVHRIESEKIPEFWIIPYPEGEPRKLNLGAEIHGFSWMPDGRFIVFDGKPGAGSTMHLWLADTKKSKAYPLTTGTNEEMAPSVSPDGKKVLFASTNFQYDLIEVPLDGSPLKNLTSTPRNEKAPAWAPNGNQFAYVSDRNGIDIIWLKSNLEGWERPLVTEKDFTDNLTLSFSRPVFSPDGRRIAYHRNTTGTQSEIWISNLAGGSPIRLFSEKRSQFAPTWSPDGDWISYVYMADGKNGIAKARVGGSETPTVLRDKTIYYQPQWSPKGDWISYQTAKGVFLTSPDGKQNRLLSQEPWLINGWSKEGSTLYAIRQTRDRRLLVISVDMQSGEEKMIADLGASPLLVTDAPFAGFSLGPDGKSFATSLLRAKGDLWMLEGFMPQHGPFSFLNKNN